MKHLLPLISVLLIAHTNLSAQGTVPFVTTWETTGMDEEITIPVQPGLTYNYDIDWGDGISQTGLTMSATHEYASADTYQISITGDFPAIFIDNKGDKEKIVSIDQWGNIAWESMKSAFYGASNMTYAATDLPDLSDVTDMSRMFRDATIFNGDIGAWEVDSVVLMNDLFRAATSFDQEISLWDVSEVVNMFGMFYGATAFNQDLGPWAVKLENVTDMSFMFFLASSFNQDIGAWDVSSVTNMGSMLRNATAFNQDISLWDISQVADMNKMLNLSNLSITNYDQLLCKWAMQEVQDSVTFGANGLNYCASQSGRDALEITKGWTIQDAGVDCTEMRPFVTTWETTTMNEDITIPIESGLIYNYDIDWGDGVAEANVTTSATHQYASPGTYQISITGQFPAIYINNGGDRLKLKSIDQWGDIAWESMRRAFRGASNMIYAATDAPDLSLVTDMSRMFQNATNFNGDIGDWEVSSVTNMASAFAETELFNQDIGDWDVGSVTNMDDMFSGASAFNQDIGEWKVNRIRYMNATFNNASSFNQDIGEWDVDSVVSMRYLFQGAPAFNQDIGNWNVSNVEYMGYMFEGATAFNHDISSWDVSKVDDMKSMFEDATSFNQDIGDWDVTSHKNMVNMLDNSGISQLNYDGILAKWSQQNAYSQIDLGAAGLEYCYALNARTNLTNTSTNNWTISGDSKNCVNALPCFEPITNIWTGSVSEFWNDASNWSLGTVPSTCDDVTIPNGSVVTLNEDAECYLLDIQAGATVDFSNYELIVWNLFVNAG